MNQVFRFGAVIGLGFLAALSIARGGRAEELETDVTLPLVVNILEGAGVTPAEVDAAVARANEIYKQAKVRLQVVKMNNNVPKPGNGDDNLSLGERNDLRRDGANELPTSSTGVTQGVKITFAKVPDEDHLDYNGLAIHKNPVAIVRTNPKTGNTVAHEIGHILTLDDLKPPTSDADDRLMWGYADRTDTKLTPAEIAEIRGEAARRGLVWTWGPANPQAPSVPGQNQRGAKAAPGPANLLAPDYADIWMATMTSPNGLADFDLRLTLGGLVPPTEPITYRVLVDADNDSMTGSEIAGKPGIDRVIRAEVNGLAAPQFFLDTIGGGSAPLAGGTIIREPEFYDSDIYVAGTNVGQDVLDVQVPRSLLGLAPGTPVFNTYAVSGNPDDPYDLLDMPLDMHSDTSGPKLTADRGLVNRSGGSLALWGSDFQPNAQVQILLDDLPLMTVLSDPLGQFSIPMLPLPNLTDEYYFLTALDAEHAEFGGAVVHTVPEPSTIVLLGVGVVGLFLCQRRRRKHVGGQMT